MRYSGEMGRRIAEMVGRPPCLGPSRVARLALALSAALIGSALVSPAARADVKQAYVQGRRADLDFSLVGSVSLDFRRSNRPGNLIVVFVVWDNGGGVSLSDSSGNTYAPAVDPTQTGGDSPLSAQIFYAGDIKGGANNVTVTFADPIDKHASIEMHFEKLDHFNSSTIAAVIRFIQDARQRGVKLIIVYNQALKWQKLSFDAMRVFVR